MSRIIVNADDFGWHEQETDAILECFRHGWINQTTLIVTSPYADEAVCRARAGGVADKVGLHLNFTSGKPLTDPIRNIGTICDKMGMFKHHIFGNGVVPLSGETADAIRIEARAQIKKYCSYGLPLMHCDGHHHVHNRLQFAYIIVPLLKEFGFKTVRNRYSIFTRPWIRGVRGRLKIGMFECLARHNGLAYTSGFGGWNGESLLKWKRYDSFELMVHPNYDAVGNNVNVVDFAKTEGPAMSALRTMLDQFDGV